MVARRFWAALLAVVMLLACTAAFCEDDDEEFEEFDDDPNGFNYFNDISGFEERNFNVENGDYTYQLTEDGESAFIVKYHGPEADVVVPDHMEEYPLVVMVSPFSKRACRGMSSTYAMSEGPPLQWR